MLPAKLSNASTCVLCTRPRCLRLYRNALTSEIRLLTTATRSSSASAPKPPPIPLFAERLSPPNVPTPAAAPNDTASGSPVTLPYIHPTTYTYHTTTPPPSPAQVQYADLYFSRSLPHSLFSCPKFRDFPPSSAPEVAFLGRSNVGKSSLLNALLNQTESKLARVSSVPGRTQMMNAYGVGGFYALGGGIRKRRDKHGKPLGGEGERYVNANNVRLIIVDCPGYGKGSRQEWGMEVMKYLLGRKQLRRAFLLIDALHGPLDSDITVFNTLRAAGIPIQIVLSKIDKIIQNARTTAHNLIQVRILANKISLALLQAGGPGRWPAVGQKAATALGDVLACSGTTPTPNTTSTADKRRVAQRNNCLGVNGLRWAVLCAAGLECDEHGHKRSFAVHSEDAEDSGEERDIPIRRVGNEGKRLVRKVWLPVT